MKIVNNRENIWDVKLTDTHFVRERESRYGTWKNRMEKNGYKRSDSRNGYWKNGAAASVNRYVKDRNGSRFRSQSSGAGFNRFRSKSGGAGFSKDRTGSQPKQKSELAKDVEEIKKDMKEMKTLLDELKKAKANCVNHFVEEEYEVNVRFVDEAKGMNMIVDSGAPVSIATSGWMEKYLKNMEVRKEEITENECKRKFRMGENIYLSNREITLSVGMKTEKDDYIRRMITVSIVYSKEWKRS